MDGNGDRIASHRIASHRIASGRAPPLSGDGATPTRRSTIAFRRLVRADRKSIVVGA
jgi:hypothetical protein